MEWVSHTPHAQQKAHPFHWVMRVPARLPSSQGEGVPGLLPRPSQGTQATSLRCSQMSLSLRATKGKQELAWPEIWLCNFKNNYYLG